MLYSFVSSLKNQLYFIRSQYTHTQWLGYSLDNPGNVVRFAEVSKDGTFSEAHQPLAQWEHVTEYKTLNFRFPLNFPCPKYFTVFYMYFIKLGTPI